MTQGGADPSRREDKWDDNTQVRQTGPLKTMSECGVGTRFWWAEGKKELRKAKQLDRVFFKVWRSMEGKERSCCKMVETEACPLLLEQRTQVEEAAGEGCWPRSHEGWGRKDSVGLGEGGGGEGEATGSGMLATGKEPAVQPRPGLLTWSPSQSCCPQKDSSEGPVK